MTCGPMVEMPRYKSHKIVYALKIAAAERLQDGSVKLVFADARYAPITKDPEWGIRFKPENNNDDPGYYVVYSPDGYASWSPTKAFEDGYTLIS